MNASTNVPFCPLLYACKTRIICEQSDTSLRNNGDPNRRGGGANNGQGPGGHGTPPDAGRGRVDVPGGPEDRPPVGEGGQAVIDPAPRRAPPLPRVRDPWP